MATESNMAGTTLPSRQSQSQSQAQTRPPHSDEAAAAAAATSHQDDSSNGNNDEENRDGAASPPLPQRHTAVTPGIRAAYLQQLYAQTLKHTLGKLDWKNVAGCYPTISENAESVLRQVQGQMVDKLQEKCEKEFENIMVSRQVVAKLNELEGLIGDASHRRTSSNGPDPTPPHLLPPSQILSAHMHPSLAHHQSQLNARLQTTQSQNALLFDEVRRQRDEIDALTGQLEAVLRDVEGANAALEGVVGELAAESRAAVAAEVKR